MFVKTRGFSTEGEAHVQQNVNHQYQYIENRDHNAQVLGETSNEMTIDLRSISPNARKGGDQFNKVFGIFDWINPAEFIGYTLPCDYPLTIP